MIFWHSLKQNYHKDIFWWAWITPVPLKVGRPLVTSGLVNLLYTGWPNIHDREMSVLSQEQPIIPMVIQYASLWFTVLFRPDISLSCIFGNPVSTTRTHIQNLSSNEEHLKKLYIPIKKHAWHSRKNGWFYRK